ncbi:MAG: cobalamin B12-binding domain-containing protein [Chloroflexi bacterium]|nr:cobalamin B12-binding domain-containing protein [Chloroflexota bacterium]
MDTPKDRPPRVLVAKVGLDGHDRGAKVIARFLRDAGMEVIYTGLHQTPEQVIQTAIQEDVDIVGLSFLSGAHIGLTRKVIEGLKAQGVADKPVVVGGTMVEDDIAPLQAMGVAGIFPVGTPAPEAVEAIRRLATRRSS